MRNPENTKEVDEDSVVVKNISSVSKIERFRKWNQKLSLFRERKVRDVESIV